MKELTKKDFEDNYQAKDHKYCTYSAAEKKFEMMDNLNVAIGSVD